MSDLHRLAAATVCAGYEGTAADVPAQLGLLPAGVILFARNAASSAAVRADLEALGRCYGEVPPLSAVDQEGGRVARLTGDVVELPAMMALGATGDTALARRAGAALGRDLRRYGLTMNLAPVLDLALEPESTVVGTRALGSDPEQVAALGAALVRGMLDEGVAPVGKHFPGHGATADDSHLGRVVVAADAATLHARDLVPFRAAIAAGVPALMTAHVVVPAFDPTHAATLSRPLLDGLLRRELGFGGVLVTDALEMRAIADDTAPGSAAAQALAAGADCICASAGVADARAAIEGIVAAVHDGALAEARVREAAQRVAALRRRFAPAAPPEPAGPVDPQIGREIALRAVTILRGDPRLPPAAPVTVISFEGATREGAAGTMGARGSLNAALRARRRRSEIWRIALEPTPDDVALLRDLLATPVPRSVVLVTRRAWNSPAQRAAAAAVLAAAPEALLVCAREPHDAAWFPQARRIACIYGDEQVSFDALAEVIDGRFAARGRLPVDVRGWPRGAGLEVR